MYGPGTWLSAWLGSLKWLINEVLVPPGKRHDCYMYISCYLQLQIGTALCPLPSSSDLQNVCRPPTLCIPLVTVRLEIGVCVC